jgi:hypothetical protein
MKVQFAIHRMLNVLPPMDSVAAGPASLPLHQQYKHNASHFAEMPA